MSPEKSRRGTEINIKLQRLFGDKPSCCSRNRFCESLYWTCRRIQLWMCFYNDEVEFDVEDLLSNPFNTQPPSLDELIRRTGFRKDWIMFVYRNFKQICANGRMSLHQWQRVFRMVFPNAVDTDFIDRVFFAIAGEIGKKAITFEDLMICLHNLSECSCDTEPRSAVKRLSLAQFVLMMMQPDETNLVDLESFKQYLEAIFKLNFVTSAPAGHGFFDQMHASTDSGPIAVEPLQCTPGLNHYAERQFQSIDKDGDGFITVHDIERMLIECDHNSSLFSKERHFSHTALG